MLPAIHRQLLRSYLWGMETTIPIMQSANHHTLPKLRSYLWGMETFNSGILFATVRDSDPTYEAWKPVHSSDYSKLGNTPILPMRHGNKTESLGEKKNSRLRSYLWGMETICWRFVLGLFQRLRSYLWGMETIPARKRSKADSLHSDPTYEAWKPKFLSDVETYYATPILPMRHGNLRHE